MARSNTTKGKSKEAAPVETKAENTVNTEQTEQEEKMVSLLEMGKEKGLYKNEDFMNWAKTMEAWRETGTKNNEAWAEAKVFIAAWAKKIAEDEKAAKAKELKRAKDALKKALEDAGESYNDLIKNEMKSIESREQAAESKKWTDAAKKAYNKDRETPVDWSKIKKEERDKLLDPIKEEWKRTNYNPFAEDTE